MHTHPLPTSFQIFKSLSWLLHLLEIFFDPKSFFNLKKDLWHLWLWRILLQYGDSTWINLSWSKCVFNRQIYFLASKYFYFILKNHDNQKSLFEKISQNLVALEEAGWCHCGFWCSGSRASRLMCNVSIIYPTTPLNLGWSLYLYLHLCVCILYLPLLYICIFVFVFYICPAWCVSRSGI